MLTFQDFLVVVSQGFPIASRFCYLLWQTTSTFLHCAVSQLCHTGKLHRRYSSILSTPSLLTSRMLV
jgi:hypothetical protein